MSLTRDTLVVPGQKYVVLSCIGPEAPQKHEKFGIKIRGCFDTQDEAAKHAAKLQAEDPTFDIYVSDMYQWVLIPPDPSKIDDVHYTNDKLQEIMNGYKENQTLAARHFEERKREMMAKKSGETMPYLRPGDENSKYYNKPDEAPISHPAEVLERLKKENPDASMEDLVKEADKIVADEIEERKKQREIEREQERVELESSKAPTEDVEEGEIVA